MKREGLELSSDVEKEDEDVKVGKEIVAEAGAVGESGVGEKETVLLP